MSGAEVFFAAAIAKTAIDVIGVRQDAEQQKAVLRYNAQAAKVDSQVETTAGALEEARIRRRKRLLQSRIEASAAGAGLLNAGSVTDLLASSEIEAEMDVLTTRYNTMNAVRKNNELAKQARAQASFVTRNARIGRVGAILQGAGAIAGGRRALIASQQPQNPAPALPTSGGGR